MFITAIEIKNQLTREIILNKNNILYFHQLEKPVSFIMSGEDGWENVTGPACSVHLVDGSTILVNGTKDELRTRTA